MIAVYIFFLFVGVSGILLFTGVYFHQCNCLFDRIVCSILITASLLLAAFSMRAIFG